MGCGGSRHDPNGEGVPARIRPILQRRLEEIKRRRSSGISSNERHTLSRKKLLKENSGIWDEGNSSHNNHHRKSSSSQEDGAQVAPLPSPSLSDRNRATDMEQNPASEQKPVSEQKPMSEQKPVAEQKPDEEATKPQLVGEELFEDARSEEPNEKEKDHECVKGKVGSLEEAVGGDKAEVIETGNEGAGDKAEVTEIGNNEGAEDKAEVTETGNGGGGDRDFEEEGEGRMRNTFADIPSSPSFRVYFFEQPVLPPITGDDDKDDDSDDFKSPSPGNDSGEIAAPEKLVECVEHEDPEAKKTKKGKIGGRLIRAINKGRTNAAKNFWNVTSCYNMPCSGQNQHNLPVQKEVSTHVQ
ncbi:hypothetical protein Tsubulata_000620 [Turnera subulata]|uniref:Uncharacterized protein n=1 Tax=Turnera subulata TaxID=218843 RepID=A0A9Q0JR76_9ROSI|nr:hypothetical protein Tsubulata_000620 [Turnera subulata]